MLVGNDCYLDIIQPERIQVQPGRYLLSSTLGWILSGRIQSDNNGNDFKDPDMLFLTYGNNIPDHNQFASVESILLNKTEMENFWDIESIGI